MLIFASQLGNKSWAWQIPRNNKRTKKMKPYTKEQLLKRAIKDGTNPDLAKKQINQNYERYIKFRSDYSLAKATRYCIYIC